MTIDLCDTRMFTCPWTCVYIYATVCIETSAPSECAGVSVCVYVRACVGTVYVLEALSQQHFTVCNMAAAPLGPADRPLSDYKGTLLVLILIPLHFIQDVFLPLLRDCTLLL